MNNFPLALAYETKGLLIGESANREVVRGIRKIVSANDFIRHVNEILTMHMGPDFILLNVSVDFKDTVPAGELEKAITGLDQEIKQKYPRIKRIFVEAEARRAIGGDGQREIIDAVQERISNIECRRVVSLSEA